MKANAGWLTIIVMLFLSAAVIAAQSGDPSTELTTLDRGALTRGVIVDGRLEPATRDSYTFQATRSEIVLITIPVREIRTTVSVQTPEGASVPIGLIDHPNIVTAPQYLFIVPETQLYTLFVADDPLFPGESGAYQLYIETKMLEREKVLSIGETYEGNLDMPSTRDNFDLFLVRGTPGQRVTAQLVMESQNHNPAILMILNRYGQIQFGGQSGNTTNSPSLNFTLGSEWLMLLARAHGTDDGYGGEYTLTIRDNVPLPALSRSTVTPTGDGGGGGGEETPTPVPSCVAPLCVDPHLTEEPPTECPAPFCIDAESTPEVAPMN